MIPTIFDAYDDEEKIPHGFSAVKVTLDGRICSDLQWKRAIDIANKYIFEDFDIFWELDLGLFDATNHPLIDTSQFLSLTLSVRHFCDRIWKSYRDHSVGVCLYRGSLDFSKGFPWDDDQENNLRQWLKDHFGAVNCLNTEIDASYETFSAVDVRKLSQTRRGVFLLQLYCRDVTAEYLDLLANELSEGVRCFLVLDDFEVNDPAHALNLLSMEKFAGMTALLSQSRQKQLAQLGFFGRNALKKDFTQINDLPRIGVCLPSVNFFRPSDYCWLRETIVELEKKGLRYRVIPEGLLVTEWELLDWLIVSSNHLSGLGKRMLMGFTAAGGTVVTFGAAIGLSNEITKEEFWRVAFGNQKRPIESFVCQKPGLE